MPTDRTSDVTSNVGLVASADYSASVTGEVRSGVLLEYYSDSGVWVREPRLVSVEYTESIRGRARLVNLLILNRLNSREALYKNYRRIRLTDWRTNLVFFKGRVEVVDPTFSDSYGQCVKVVARDYLSELYSRIVSSNYTDSARKRSALIAQIISDYAYAGSITTDIEESGSSETVEIDYSTSKTIAMNAIFGLAKEDPWSDEEFDAVWKWDGSAWVDHTVEAASESGTDFDFLEDSSDYFYFGLNNPFLGVQFDLNTLGSYGALAWQYWNGSSWTTLTLETSYDVTADGKIEFIPPSDWAAKAFSVIDPHAAAPPDTTSRYWIRVSVASVTTVASMYYAIPIRGYGYEVWITDDDTPVFKYARRGSLPAGGPVANGLTLEYLGTTGGQIINYFGDYSFSVASTERYTRVTVRGKDSDGAKVESTETNSDLEGSVSMVKELVEEVYGETTLAYCQTRAKAVLSQISKEATRGVLKIGGMPRFYKDDAWNLVHTGNLVRVKCSNLSIDEDFVLQEFSYKEPEGIATLKLLSLDGCWEFSPFELESIFSGLQAAASAAISRAGALNSAPTTPSSWSADNVVAGSGINVDGSSILYFTITVPRVDEAISEYIVRYRIKDATDWNTLVVPQTTSGDPITKTPPVLGGYTYEFGVRSRGASGLLSTWSSTVEKAAVADTSAPSAPTNLTATGSFQSIFLTWDNPSEADLKYIEVWEADANDRSGASKIAVVYTDFFARGSLGNAVTKYYWIRGVDASGNEGAWHPTGSTDGVSATTITIGESDIDDFAIDASKLHTKIPVVSGDTWTDNSPGAGSVAWNEHHIFYNGVDYTIAAGNTDKKYIYWKGLESTYTTSDTNPTSATLGDDGFVIATNITGSHDLAWNAIANQIIGNAYIENLDAAKITTGDLAVERITAQAANAVNAGVVSISAAKLNITGLTTFASGNTLAEEINTGSTTIDGGKITTGTVVADHLDVDKLEAITADMGTLNAGEIRLGAGTVGAGFAGIRIYKSGTIYRVSSWSDVGGSDVLQAFLDETGFTVVGEHLFLQDDTGAARGTVYGASGEFLVISAEDDLLLLSDTLDIRSAEQTYFSTSNSAGRYLKIYKYGSDAYITNVNGIGGTPANLASTNIVVYANGEASLYGGSGVARISAIPNIDADVTPWSKFNSDPSGYLLEDGDDVIYTPDRLVVGNQLLMDGDIQASDDETEDIGDLNQFSNIFCDVLTTTTDSYDTLDDLALLKAMKDTGNRLYDRSTMPSELVIDKEEFVERVMAKYSKKVLVSYERLTAMIDEASNQLLLETNTPKREALNSRIILLTDKRDHLGDNYDLVETYARKKAVERYEKGVKIGPAIGLLLGGMKQLIEKVEGLEKRLKDRPT